MTSETAKLNSSLSSLTNSLDELEAQLEPLFAQSLPEFIANLDKLQQAKLQIVLPYLVYDLIFIYLKSRGINPKTHPVVSELERIRQYFDKVTNAEDPAKKRVEIDKTAAGRFIKHAIAQAKASRTPADAETPKNIAGPSTTVRVPVKVTSKMRERARYERELAMADSGSDEEGGLQVWDSVPQGDEDDMMAEDPREETKSMGKQKATDDDSVTKEDTTIGWAKRKRPAIDPFAGYGDDTPMESQEVSTPTAPSRATKRTKKR